ncbi:glycoside hydrolase family 19 protein [Pseudomonas bubulae]|uniref:glycoside hydrolase family 19 protein n=1 Tax=Pseudomonas bubulae TaxID=2316085 RepID=UPI001F1F2645|nr:glycoside hydrolase family 19 protein [Pseudomonas bubulae]MCF3193437.1 glycoside hydrolase family 19 protein [Pseudomonas bubulae]
MSITAQQLLQILPNAGQVAGVFVPVLRTAMVRYQIVGSKRIAAFIAQIGHESGQLTRLVENLNYSAEALQRNWPSRFSAELASSVARNPEQIANIAYGNRMGNAAPGDGWKYRGRGLIQITGKNNYRACGEALGLDLIAQPELLEKPRHACMSAAWFWATNGLNTFADAGKFDVITKRINGGQTGAADRQALYGLALKVLA